MIDFSKITALYGGSFDPVHLGHIHVAQEILRLKPEIKQLIFVPAAQSPGKHNPIAPAEVRLDWLNRAAKEIGAKVWGTELKRTEPSYTVNTLREATSLGATKDKLFFILGADSYKDFANWKAPDQIRNLCKLIVVSRPGNPITTLHPDDLLIEIKPHPASSTEIRQQILSGKIPAEALPKAVEEDLKNLSLKSKNPYAIQEDDGN